MGAWTGDFGFPRGLGCLSNYFTQWICIITIWNRSSLELNSFRGAADGPDHNINLDNDVDVYGTIENEDIIDVPKHPDET